MLKINHVWRGLTSMQLLNRVITRQWHWVFGAQTGNLAVRRLAFMGILLTCQLARAIRMRKKPPLSYLDMM